MFNKIKTMRGRATYPDDYLLRMSLGPCSHGTAYQLRVSSYGYFFCLIYQHIEPPPKEDLFRGDVSC